MKAVLISGASGGIGSATALRFHGAGYFVFLLGRNRKKLLKLHLTLSNSMVLKCDLSRPVEIKKSIAKIRKSKHALCALINNAGSFERESVESSSDHLWQEMFEANLLNHVRLTRHAWPLLISSGVGSIVNVSSALGIRPTQSTGAYSAMKSALLNYTQTLALAGGEFKIRANAICPGVVETPILGLDSLSESARNKKKKLLSAKHPMLKLGSPQEVANSIFFLASPQSPWVTGSILRIDGGMTLK